jgi:hypothetical protein
MKVNTQMKDKHAWEEKNAFYLLLKELIHAYPTG